MMKFKIISIICIFIIIVLFCLFYRINLKEDFYNIENFKILYIIRSIPKYYDTRLKSQKNTWFNFLTKNDQILIASENNDHINKFNLNYSIPTCPKGHTLGTCCSEAYAIVKALKEFDFDWVFILDDDVYLYPPLIRKILYKYIDNYNVGLGHPGCGTKITGFCGGGGYGFSKKALQKIVGNDYDKFLENYKNKCNNENPCDIVTGDMAKQKKIKLINIPELKPWGIKKSEKNEINENKIATLHYYGGELTNKFKKIPEKMNFLHKIFLQIKETFIGFKEYFIV